MNEMNEISLSIWEQRPQVKGHPSVYIETLGRTSYPEEGRALLK